MTNYANINRQPERPVEPINLNRVNISAMLDAMALVTGEPRRASLGSYYQDVNYNSIYGVSRSTAKATRRQRRAYSFPVTVTHKSTP